MSVINKMLQDLDKRKGRTGGEAVAGDAIRSVKPESPWRLKRAALLAILGLMLVSPAVAWWLQQHNGGVENSRAVVSSPPAVAVAVAKNPSPAASQVPPAALVPVVAVAESTATMNAAASTAAPQQVSASASAATGTTLFATASRNVVSSTESSPMGSASASITPDKVETPSPRTVATSSKASAGKTYSPEQVSANLFGEAVKLDQQGHQEEAKVPLQGLLAANPRNVRARQMLAQLQLDTGQVEQARLLLAEGQRLLPEQSNFTLTLARLQVESGDVAGAIHLLEADHSSARNEAQFHAFLAALLLRVERHDEAMQHYLVALRSDPANVSWLVGVGVAMEGVGKEIDAAEAYRRAEGSANLTPEMANFLSQRLAQIRH